jgi:hypothetical protein
MGLLRDLKAELEHLEEWPRRQDEQRVVLLKQRIEVLERLLAQHQ